MKTAKTEFRLLASCPGDADVPYSPKACSLLLCTPKTGRTHQIRRHAFHMGFPIIGDSRHGDSKINRWWRENRSLDRLFLHCLSLDLPPLSTFRSKDDDCSTRSADSDSNIDVDIDASEERIECIAPLLPELLRVLEHEELQDFWEVAKKNDPRLTLETVDERGGTFGRNYRTSSA